MWGWQAPQTVDYLTDPRIHAVSSSSLKKYLQAQGADDQVLFYASTKFALIATAEKLKIQLEPLLERRLGHLQLALNVSVKRRDITAKTLEC